MKITINICTPTKTFQSWGDTAFAQSLAKSFKNMDIESELRFQKDWYLADPDSGVTLTITGKFKFKPDPQKINLIWIISHPEIRSIDELNQFDLVFVASELFYNKIKNDIKPKCYYLPQASDQNVFYPQKNIKKIYDILFVGNNYYDNLNNRIIIQDLLDCGKKFNFFVVGKNWEKGIDKKHILSDFVDYKDLPALYSKAKIVLNDHHGLMKQYGFINNRMFDLANLNVFQLSDEIDGLDKFGVISYSDKNDLKDKITFYLENNFERERNSKIVHMLTRNENFDQRALTIYKYLREIIG